MLVAFLVFQKLLIAGEEIVLLTLKIFLTVLTVEEKFPSSEIIKLLFLTGNLVLDRLNIEKEFDKGKLFLFSINLI